MNSHNYIALFLEAAPVFLPSFCDLRVFSFQFRTETEMGYTTGTRCSWFISPMHMDYLVLVICAVPKWVWETGLKPDNRFVLSRKICTEIPFSTPHDSRLGKYVDSLTEWIWRGKFHVKDNSPSFCDTGRVCHFAVRTSFSCPFPSLSLSYYPEKSHQFSAQVICADNWESAEMEWPTTTKALLSSSSIFPMTYLGSDGRTRQSLYSIPWVGAFFRPF